jgi:hypothetical protein
LRGPASFHGEPRVAHLVLADRARLVELLGSLELPFPEIELGGALGHVGAGAGDLLGTRAVLQLLELLLAQLEHGAGRLERDLGEARPLPGQDLALLDPVALVDDVLDDDAVRLAAHSAPAHRLDRADEGAPLGDLLFDDRRHDDGRGRRLGRRHGRAQKEGSDPANSHRVSSPEPVSVT